MGLPVMVTSIARRLLPPALFEPPPSDPAVERASRLAVTRAHRAVDQWRLALQHERRFWQRIEDGRRRGDR